MARKASEADVLVGVANNSDGSGNCVSDAWIFDSISLGKLLPMSAAVA